jgi:predicted dehydrogenase
VVDAGRAAGVVVLEAFHYPFHPLFGRVVELLAAGAVGEVSHVEAPMRMPAPPDSDPRWVFELAGGSTMDLGCYSIHCARQLGRLLGGEPRIVAASARPRPGAEGVDEALSVELAYPGGATASVGSDMAADDWDFHLTVTGSAGRIHLPDFPRPHENDTLELTVDGSTTVEHLGRRSSYTYQLEGFAAAIRDGAPLPYDDAVAQMMTIDAVYAAAGFPPRPVS